MPPSIDAHTRDKRPDSTTTANAAAAAAEDMSFAVPKHVPAFGNPQREYEDRLWGAARPGNTNNNNRGKAGAAGGGVLGSVGGYFDSSRNSSLPMYKDKPYAYPPSHRQAPVYRRKSGFFLLLVVVGALFYFFGGESHKERVRAPLRKLSWLAKDSKKVSVEADWLKRREHVVEAFELSWAAYERYAWGYDEFYPMSKKGRQMAKGGLGWIIVDSLDTMMLMNLTTQLSHAREWISNSLKYDQDQDVNTFETTIRMLGGLLSAHYLSTTYPNMAPLKDDDEGSPGEDLYLEKAKDLADRVLAAFDTKSGVPYASVNLAKFQGIESHADMGASSTAEATTLQLEFKYLSKLTGEKLFWDKAEKVMEVVDGQVQKWDGLVPIFISPSTGIFQGENIRYGSRGDSYYEYLIKQYLQTNGQERVYRDMWEDSMEGMRKHLVTYTQPSGFTIIGERPSGLKGPLSPKMDHLACFMPGTIALAVTGGKTEAEARRSRTWTKQNDEDMRLARELMHTCWGMYKYMATGLAAEITYFEVATPTPEYGAQHPKPPTELDADPDAEWRKDFVVKSADSHNLQRPETVESLFYMWRITGDVKYREWGWEMFRSFVNYTAVEDGGGFTSLSNANKIPPETRDNMESFWLAETLKYFYLLFSPNDLLPLDSVVINTEAHPLPRFDMGPLFSTGWSRDSRNAKESAVTTEGEKS